MKKMFLFAVAITAFSFAKANTNADTTAKVHLYNPKANAEADIAKAVAQAKREHKNVFIQLGGNWCPWCLEFNRFVTTDSELDSTLHTNYVVYHLNYSPENKNAKTLERLQFPNRFGFPCFIILDENGKEIHIQDSAYLEKGSSYDKDKVFHFFYRWTPKALQASTYKKVLGL
ncbi:hypothetical protein A9P82_03825 [Arachidicoccus ginsenosidimutans]|uniref:thioredoxin family protein n=1 Tax=Arachidicoccus sp. BS20 TaxID=1850526 RepID=UPI0007F1394E|nr:thioredoxin family protein [Arachidicoccus sp. BS20]ANI88502.1 hypothetical protein A9P82_03825 [Arachidicoccus sp. BS20]